MRAVLVTSFALALAWAPVSNAEEATALIWKGAKTEAEAKSLRPSWEGIGAVLSTGGVAMPKDFPTLVESKTLPGLKPGFWVWVVGFCPRNESAPVLEQLKTVAPDTYARDVQVPKERLACPDVQAATLEVNARSFKLAGGRVLRVLTYEDSEEPEADEPGDSYTRTHYVFALTGKTGEVLDTVSAVGEETFSGDIRNGPSGHRCSVSELRQSKKDTVVFIRQCAATVAECGSVVSADEVTTVTISGASVTSKETRRNEERQDCGD
ncbi:hypothetical protein ACLESO_44050 [Pyxidicoccus sp. 3LG]